MPTASSPGRRRPAIAAIIALAATMTAIELTLDASDLGLVGDPSWRAQAFRYGAFQTGLLQGGRPAYGLQPVAMFVTYAFLHAGFWHLASNMVALLALGPAVVRRAGPRGFAAIYLAATIGGGLGFALLSSGSNPMVGASGALFGLVGAWHCREWRDRRARGRPLWPLWRAVAGLVALNLVMWLALSGLLAWQTHLGGYIAGWATTAAVTGTGRQIRRP